MWMAVNRTATAASPAGTTNPAGVPSTTVPFRCVAVTSSMIACGALRRVTPAPMSSTIRPRAEGNRSSVDRWSGLIRPVQLTCSSGPSGSNLRNSPRRVGTRSIAARSPANSPSRVPTQSSPDGESSIWVMAASGSPWVTSNTAIGSVSLSSRPLPPAQSVPRRSR